MSNENSKVSTEKEKYFRDAFEWYCEKYLLCISERAWLCIASVFILIFFTIFTVGIYSLFPIKTSFTLVKYTDRHADEFSVIRKLSKNNEESAQVSIARYLVGKYVEEYESYNYDDLTYQFNFVKNNSSRKVYLSFRGMMSLDNTNSPIVKYKKDISKTVVISDIKLSIVDSALSSSSGAIVKFHAKENDKSVISTLSEKTVSLKFSLSNIKMNAAKVLPLEFMVTEYTPI